MKPAFSSNRETLGFSLLVLLALTLPALLARINWGDRRELYSSIPNSYGPFPWISKMLFTRTNDVDMAFLGSSHLWYAVDTPFVQRQLSQQLQREAEVFSLGWVWAGYEVAYAMARDLLSRRRVHTLVIYNEHAKFETDNFHRAFRYWYREGERPDILAGLAWPAKLRLYAIAVTGMPRQLLNLLRTNPVPKSELQAANINDADRRYWRMDEPAMHLGAATCRGRIGAPGVVIDSPRFHAKSGSSPADVVVDADRKHPAFYYSNAAVPTYQLHFARLLAELCRQHGTRLVVLHVPTLYDARDATMFERAQLIATLDVPIVGISGAKLFAEISDAELRNLFVEPGHLNHNGQELFTQLITPALLALHAKPRVH